MDNQEKPVYHRTCRNPLCLKGFNSKRVKQEYCSSKCRQAAYMAKRDAVIDAALEYIVENWNKAQNLYAAKQTGLPMAPGKFLPLYEAVCDLEGWNKDGERP